MDRVVKKETDFERFAGQEIQVKLRIPHNNRRNFQGQLLGCKDGKVSLRLEKEDTEFEFNNIEKARLVPRFD
jgi:ribosome maturation factor RimP